MNLNYNYSTISSRYTLLDHYTHSPLFVRIAVDKPSAITVSLKVRYQRVGGVTSLNLFNGINPLVIEKTLWMENILAVADEGVKYYKFHKVIYLPIGHYVIRNKINVKCGFRPLGLDNGYMTVEYGVKPYLDMNYFFNNSHLESKLESRRFDN